MALWYIYIFQYYFTALKALVAFLLHTTAFIPLTTKLHKSVSPFCKKIQPFEILKISSKWPTLLGGSKIPLDLLVWSALRPWEVFWTPVSPFRKKIQPFEILKISSKWPTLLWGSKMPLDLLVWSALRPWESFLGLFYLFFILKAFCRKRQLEIPNLSGWSK